MTPTEITIPAGTEVAWINKDSSLHNIVSGTPEKGPDNIFFGESFYPGETYNVTLDKPGVYEFYDTYPHIKGKITVTGSQAAVPTTTAPTTIAPTTTATNNNVFTINPGATDANSQTPMTPTEITIPAGTEVAWINKDSSLHNIVSGTPEKGPNNIFFGESFYPGDTYNVTLDKPGVYEFYDTLSSH